MPISFYILIAIIIIVCIGAAAKGSEKPLTQEDAERKKKAMLDKANSDRPPIPENGIMTDKGIYEDRIKILEDNAVSIYTDDFTGQVGAKITRIAGYDNNWLFLYSRIDNTGLAKMNVFAMSFHFLDNIMFLQFMVITGDYKLSQQENIKIRFENGQVFDIGFGMDAVVNNDIVINQCELSPELFKTFVEYKVDKIRFEDLNNAKYCIVDFNFDMSKNYISKEEIQYNIQMIALEMGQATYNIAKTA